MTIEISAKELAEFDRERSRKTDFPRAVPWSELDDRERRVWIESAAAAIGDGLRMRRYRDAQDLLLLRKAIDRYRDAQDVADKARKLGPKLEKCPICFANDPTPCERCGSVGYVNNRAAIDAAENEERVALEELEEARRRVDE